MSGQNGDFNFSHVQPTAMLRCVMELQFFHQLPGFFGRVSFIERGRRVGVEIVQDYPDFFCFRPVDVNHFIHTNGKILFGTPGGHFHVSPTGQGFQKYKQVAGSFAAVFVVIADRFSRLKRQGLSRFADQLIRNLVKTDHGIVRLVGFSIQIQNVFHPPDEFSLNDRGNAPFLPYPRLELIFFSDRRTASTERLSKWVKATRRSVNNCTVQRLRPSGGLLWAIVVNIVSILSSILGKRPARDRSLKAKLSPPFTNFLRVRKTVGMLVCRVVAISKSVLSASASSNIFARLIFRAPGRPFRVSSINCSFSSFVKSTMYTLAISFSFAGHGQFYISKFIW